MEKTSLKWWHKASVYQIYPLSYQDSNGDGMGDIKGIISRLDHIKNLGIDVIWLSPVFQSPMKDNGYDVSDYRSINPTFGTLEDLSLLVKEVHRRGMKIISDIVLNHTSDQHPWFLDAVNNIDSPYRDYYIFRKEINDIQSVFSGPAWTKLANRDEYYFHFFAKDQPDLNWQNKALREKLYDILNDWLSFGFDGFRLDVIDLIGKDIDKKLIGHGPYYHEFLKELKTKVLHNAELFTVGELSGSSAEQAAAVTGSPNGVFSMAFQFSHLWLDEQPGQGKWALKKLEVEALKQTFLKLDHTFRAQGWNALFMGNHDQPRPISRYGSEIYRYQSQTMLFLAFFGQRGTPFIYQGEEIGMINYPFESIEAFNDIESINYYHAELGQQDKASILKSLRAKGRDNARTPMQWDQTVNAGFSTHKPWLAVHPLYKEINVKADFKAPLSIQMFLVQFLQYRKKHDVFIDGTLCYVDFNHQDIYAYIRENSEKTVLIITSFSPTAITIKMDDHKDWTCVLSNDRSVVLSKNIEIPPFFGAMYERRKKYGND
jgi:oligo-1,6-glucosidase